MNVRKLTCWILLVLVLATGARAGFVLGEHNWDPGPHGWTNQFGWTTLETPSTGGNTGGWLKVTFPANTAPTETFEIISTPANNLFAGAWTTNMWVEFDFWTGEHAATNIQVQWQSSTNSESWAFQLSSQPTQTWSSLSASFANWEDWTFGGGGGTESQYLDELSSIGWIGVYIGKGGPLALEAQYGIDNFSLMVPEPGQYSMVFAAMMTLAMSWRRKRRAGPTFHR